MLLLYSTFNLILIYIIGYIIFKVTEGIKPTLSELQKFEESVDGVDPESNTTSILKAYF